MERYDQNSFYFSPDENVWCWKQTSTGKIFKASSKSELLKIKEKNLNYLDFSNSDLVKVGQWVLAVGNPLDLKSTVTSGIISAKARNINILRGEKFSVESFLPTSGFFNLIFLTLSKKLEAIFVFFSAVIIF